MSPKDASAAVIRRLRAEVNADRVVLDQRCQEVSRYSQGAEAPSPERTAALALTLDRCYTVLESILERIARCLEGGLPHGSDWHQRLLKNARIEIETVRPAVLGDEASVAASDLRTFRHFLRHAYAAELDGPRVRELAGKWLETLREVEGDLDRFDAFLTSVAERLEQH